MMDDQRRPVRQGEGECASSSARRPPAPAVVVPYDSQWPRQFDSLRTTIDAALAGIPHTTEHVGSTAVVGLAAKPIIDIDVVVASVMEVGPAVDALTQAGWQPEGDLRIAGREALAPPAGLRYHHLYVVVAGCQAHRDHVDLRDFLQTQPLHAARYARRKHELAGLLATNRAAYTDGKAELIAELLRIARELGGAR
jgi:GrpB-like predicted nucleotidyltransferase (UPF0157 family)